MTTVQSGGGSVASTTPRAGKPGLSHAEIAIAALTALAFVGLYFRWFAKQSHFSIGKLEDWGHAFFVPVIAGYLVWQRRRELSQTSPRVFLPGLVPVLTGIAAYLTFSIGPIPGVHMNQGVALIITVFGIALTLLGPDTMRYLILPIAFLVFGVTISEKVMLTITWPMQLIASQGAFVLLGVTGMIGGFQVVVEGNVLTVIDRAGQEFPLNVAQACSGMRMVVAFIALGAAVALLSCRLWWQRIAVFMLAVPVALLMNILRVTVLGLLTLKNPDLAQGEAHTLIGTLLLVPALGAFLGVVWVLNKLVDLPPPAKIRPGGSFRPSLLRPTALSLLAVLSVSALGMGWAIKTYEIHLTKLPIYAPEGRSLGAIPRETDHWRTVGPDRIESAEVLEELGTRNYVTRTYVEKNVAPDANPRVLELHAAYYTDQIDTVPHVPERCFVGGGLQQTASSKVIPFTLDRTGWLPDPNSPESGPHVMTARTSTRWSEARGTRVRLPEGIDNIGLRTSAYSIPKQGEIYAGYFFIANGSVATSAEQVRLLAFDLSNDYAYYLKVQVNASGGGEIDSPEALAEAAGDLMAELLPDMMRCVPDWVEVSQGRYPAQNTDTNTDQPTG